jgi:hypothetical protein
VGDRIDTTWTDGLVGLDLSPDENGKVTTAQAAAFLDTSVQNIVGRYHSGAITGHQHPAGKGGTIFLDAESVRAYRTKKGRRRGPAPTRHDAELAATLSRIEARLDALEELVASVTRPDVNDAQTAAVLGLLAVSDEQRAATIASDETAEHMARAVLSTLESKRALGRADHLRDEILRQFSIPRYPPTQ